jgi:hypothetical protein
MKKDNIPAFELEKAAVSAEIERGLETGVKHLIQEEPQQREDHFHNTRFLLRQYRRVEYAIRISESDLNLRMEMEHGTQMSALEVNADLAGIDLTGSKLEGYTKSIIRSQKMLQIIQNALDTVRLDPENGELLYQVLFLTYFSPQKPKNREAIVDSLDRMGYPMSVATYHNYLNKGIRAIDHILWGYTTIDCMEIIRNFLP